MQKVNDDDKRGPGKRLGLDPARVVEVWREMECNYSAAARKLGCSTATIRHHLRQVGKGK